MIYSYRMGLGKTLQCITLLWTLLKQSPIAGKPSIEKAIVACPSSLVKNWANEFDKWLGPGAIHPLAVDGKQTKANLLTSVRQWISATGRRVPQPVMIVSYETLRGTLVEELGRAPVGLLLCDEGHRLKNAGEQQIHTNHACFKETGVTHNLGWLNFIQARQPNLCGSQRDQL